MKNTYVIIAVIVVVLVGGGLLLFTSKNAQAPVQSTNTSPAMTGTTSASTAQGTTAANNSTAAATAAAPAASPAPQHFTVNGNDATADLKTITVAKGTPVTITFGADSGTTYHGGLDFRSSVVSTGTITPGSTKTISFTANQSFSFTPYWPATNIAKPYTINVVVQ